MQLRTFLFAAFAAQRADLSHLAPGWRLAFALSLLGATLAAALPLWAWHQQFFVR